MATKKTEVAVPTNRKVQVLDVTPIVAEACRRLALRDGILLVSIRHTTCALCINEDEAGLRHDFERLGETLLHPFRGKDGFRHDRIDDNAQAHLTSILLGHSVTLPLAGGEPILGTWQRLLLIEMDGPRTRSLDITFVGE